MRAGELESWFEAPDWPRRDVEYIQINETPGELWLGLPSAHMLVGSASLVLRQILDAAQTRRGGVAVAREAWIATLAQARERHESRHAQSVQAHADCTPIHTAELCQAIADVIDKDATVIYDSYSGSLYLSEMLTAHFPGQILDAGPRVALGQGVGMAFGAALARPGKQIITLVGDGGIGLSGMDVETFSRYGVPAVVVVLNNSSWGGNALARTEIQPGIGSWDMTPGLRYDAVMQPLGCHVEHVERSADLRPALQRALASGKVAVVNVVADTDGTGVSLPWLRLKIGEFWSRGIDDLPASVIKHFHAVSPLEALRLQKTARDNGTNIDLAFMSAITGHSEQVLRDLADKLSYSQT